MWRSTAITHWGDMTIGAIPISGSRYAIHLYKASVESVADVDPSTDEITNSSDVVN